MNYGDRLRELRNKKGLSQKGLADKLNLNRSTYARYETSTTQPDYDTLKKLADFFDVTTDYILGNSNQPQLTEKDEKDIAKRMEKMKEDLLSGGDGDGLSFMGEPLSEEATESLLEALEHAERIATLTNKKFIPKKHRK